MSTRRVRIGIRPDGLNGIFVSPVGVDAVTAGVDSLLLNINQKQCQLVMAGSISSPQTITLGFTRQPYVFITSSASMASIPGFESFAGPCRPSPVGFTSSSAGQSFDDYAQVQFQDGGNKMTITTPNFRTNFEVYNDSFA